MLEGPYVLQAAIISQQNNTKAAEAELKPWQNSTDALGYRDTLLIVTLWVYSRTTNTRSLGYKGQAVRDNFETSWKLEKNKGTPHKTTSYFFRAGSKALPIKALKIKRQN